MNTLEDPDTRRMSGLGEAPPCEGRTHSSGTGGHVPGTSAAYLIGAPCGISWLACAGWVDDANRHLTIECERCGSHLTVAHSFVPLVSMGVG